MDKELQERIREMEKATGNPVRIREMPDGSILLDYSTPGKKKVVAPGLSRRDRRRKKRGD